MNKYRNRRTEVNGEVFDSKREAAHWADLLLLHRAGEIRNLRRQVRIPLEVNGIKVCVFICDFVYDERNGTGWHEILDDSKGIRTPVYLLKKRLVRAILGREIRET